MKDKRTQLWIPLYVDKWIFGSTRLELEPDERGVFLDLMVLSAKDEGYIRANESMGYHPRQLAGLLNITEELLLSTITKCKNVGKLEEPMPGIYKLAKWDNYQLSEDYRYRIETGRKQVPGIPVRQNSDYSPTKPGPIREDRIREDKTLSMREFVRFWAAYPKKKCRARALEAWNVANPPIDKCLATIAWQSKSEEWTKDGGRYIPKPEDWLNDGRWNDVSPQQNFVICPICGHDGVVDKSHTGKISCKKCGAEVKSI